MDPKQYMQAFLDESTENVQVLNRCVLRLEAGDTTEDDLAAMFRAAHTLKGMSATMGFTDMAHLTHRLEDLLGALRTQPQRTTRDIVDVVFMAIDGLESSLQAIAQSGQEDDHLLHDVLTRLDAVAASSDLTGDKRTPSKTVEAPQESWGQYVATVAEQARAVGMAVGVLAVSVASDSALKGARALLVERAIEQHGEVLACDPPVEEMEAGNYADALQFVVAVRPMDVEQMRWQVEHVSEVTATRWSAELSFAATTAAVAADGGKEHPASTPTDGGPASANAPGNRRAQEASGYERTIRMPVQRLDGLMNLLSELVIDKNRLSTLTDHGRDAAVKEVVDHLGRVSSELQSAIMGLRMTPIDTLFQRFPRMVRDLAKSLDKQVRFVVSGAQTEFDRTVIDEMGEALVHLIRNSMDHGIEDPAQRSAAGKPEEGTLSIQAFGSGQHVVIEVSDDGRGVQTEKVLRKAIDSGLVTAAQAAALSEDEVCALLFRSGFSTAQEVSDISGRGVGLDAVQRKVESLGGHITIRSTAGAGTVFRIQLPLTLAISEALLVRVASEFYALPLSSVEVAIIGDSQTVRRVQGQAVLERDGQVIPIIDASAWLYEEPSPTTYPWQLVVCAQGSRKLAIRVDELLGQQEIVYKSLGDYLHGIPWFSGATILGDGRIALIIDVHRWMVA